MASRPNHWRDMAGAALTADVEAMTAGVGVPNYFLSIEEWAMRRSP